MFATVCEALLRFCVGLFRQASMFLRKQLVELDVREITALDNFTTSEKLQTKRSSISNIIKLAKTVFESSDCRNSYLKTIFACVLSGVQCLFFTFKMVFKTKDILICHQPHKHLNQVDVNVKRLEIKLEKEGFVLWTESEPKRFQEGVDRSKVIVVCVSRQAQLSDTFNEKINYVINSGKPVAVVTVEPEYEIPKEEPVKEAEPEPIDPDDLLDMQLEQAMQGEDEIAEEEKLPNMFPYLSHYYNFVICGKTNARTNVYR